ncbi:MAG: hypothetical protein ACI89U_003133, partial [Gammaproteobacteria bacterium]
RHSPWRNKSTIILFREDFIFFNPCGFVWNNYNDRTRSPTIFNLFDE